MSKKHWFIFLVLVAFFASFFVLRFWNKELDVAFVTLSGETLEVLLPKTLGERYRGLGGRESIAPYDGMLFVYDTPGLHGIVMRDMNFPIDIVWLYQGRVVDMALRVKPEFVAEADLTIHRPNTDATLVLELPAGWIEVHGLEMGDELTIQDVFDS